MIQLQVLGRPRRLFYGWLVVAAGFANQTLHSGLGFQGFGTFLVPLELEFGWSKTALSGARSLMQMENGLLGPIEGVVIDRYGPRRTMAAGMFIFGAGLVLFGFIQSLWSYYLAFVVIALGTSVGGFLVTSTAINYWFRRKRTLALSIAQAGLGFGGVAIIPLLVWAQVEFGWRTAAIAAGMCAWGVGIPLALLMRHSPERYGVLPDGDPLPAAGEPQESPVGRSARGGGLIDFTLAEALRTRAFWLIGIGHGLAAMIVGAVVTHQFAHMEQGADLARSSAALVVTVLSATNLVSRLLGGVLGDRYDKRYLAAIGTAVGSVSLVVLATAESLGQAMVYAVLFGFAWGIRGPMMSSIRGEYFGRASFGKIAGTSFLLTTPGAIVGPVFAGLMADTQGDYVLGFIILAAVSGVGTLLFLLTKPPLPPPRLRGPLPPQGRGGSQP